MRLSTRRPTHRQFIRALNRLERTASAYRRAGYLEWVGKEYKQARQHLLDLVEPCLRYPPENRAFTLIELLVCVGIGALIALLIIAGAGVGVRRPAASPPAAQTNMVAEFGGLVGQQALCMVRIVTVDGHRFAVVQSLGNNVAICEVTEASRIPAEANEKHEHSR